METSPLESSSSKAWHKHQGWVLVHNLVQASQRARHNMAGIPYSSEKCVPMSSALFLTQKEEPFCLASSNGKPQSGKGRKWHWGAWEMEHIQSSQTRLEPMTFTVYTIGGWGGPVYLCCSSSQPWGSTPDKMTRLLCVAAAQSSPHNSLNQHSLPQDKAAGAKLTQGCRAKPNTEKRGLWGLGDSPPPLGAQDTWLETDRLSPPSFPLSFRWEAVSSRI